MAKLKKPIKPKKKHTGLKVFLALFVVFVVAPVACVYGFFYDSNSKKVEVNKDTTIKDLGSQIVVDSLDGTKETEKLTIKVTADDLDQFLYNATSSIRNEYIKKVYCLIKGDIYKFYLDVNVPAFKTRLCLKTKLMESEDKAEFVFKITDISIGRVNGINKLAKSVLNTFLSEDKINSMLSDNDVNATYDSENMEIHYKKSQLIIDINKMTSSEDYSMYIDIIQAVVESDLMTLDTSYDNAMAAVIDLTTFKTNDYVTDLDGQLFIESNQVIEKCQKPLVQLLNNGIVKYEENAPLGNIFSYLFHGWEDSTATVQETIKNYDLSSINIPDVEAYKGFDLNNGVEDLVTIMENKIDVDSLISGETYLCNLTENEINNYMKTRSMIGYTTLLHKDNGDGTYKANYITIENFYINLYKEGEENYADFVVKIDINGYVTSLVFHCTSAGAEGTKMNFNIQQIEYGNIETDALKEKLMSLVSNALQESDGSIILNKETSVISFDFANLLKEAQTKTENRIKESQGLDVDLTNQFSGDNLNIDIIGANKEVIGELKLSLKNKIN